MSGAFLHTGNSGSEQNEPLALIKHARLLERKAINT